MSRRVRGSVMNAYLKFVKKKWGKTGLDKCLSDMGLKGEFVDGEYYHSEIHENLLRWIHRTHGMEAVEAGGRFVIQNLGIISWVVRFASVKKVLNKFPVNYSEVYTFGHVEVDTSRDDVLYLRLYDVNHIEEACHAWLGVCKGGMKMTKTKGTVTETKCFRKGDDCCEYTFKLV